jgi:hypothetical protein
MGLPFLPVTYVAIFNTEDFEERAINAAAYKPHWFCDINSMFVISPYGSERQKDFLEYLNNMHYNIQFSMEKEKDGHLPFLDIYVYRKPDGSFSHMVYRKPIQINLYLMQCHTTNMVVIAKVHRSVHSGI